MVWIRNRSACLARTVWALFAAGMAVAANPPLSAAAADGSRTGAVDRPGFLVVVRDRGARGNRELADLLAGVESDYPLAVLHVGDDGQGVENGYQGEIDAASRSLREAGVGRIVAIPLFLFAEERLLTDFHDRIARSVAPLPLEWAPALADSYLFEEILRDRFLSRDPQGDAEHWILVDSAPDRDTAQVWGARISVIAGRLAALLGSTGPAHVAVLLDDEAEGAEEQNDALFARLRARPDGGRRVVVVPAMIGIKYTRHMSRMSALRRALAAPGIDVSQPILPHPLIRTHVKREINRALKVEPGEVGVIVMAHGATKPYNDIVRATLEPVLAGRAHAFAFGMADPESIAEAAAALEAQGVRQAVVYRLFAYRWTFRRRTDFILGLRADVPPPMMGEIPARVRSAIRFVSIGGYQDDPRIARILADRTRELSREPAREAVIILSHGAGDAAVEARQQAVVEKNIRDMQRFLPAPFAAVRAMSLREDWPDARARAVNEIRAYIEGRRAAGIDVLILSNRLLGDGPYRRYLGDVSDRMNGTGLLPHPLFADIIGERIAAALPLFTKGRESGSAGGESLTGRAEALHALP